MVHHAPPHQIHQLRYHQHHLQWRSIKAIGKAIAQMQTTTLVISQTLSGMAGHAGQDSQTVRGPQWPFHCLPYLPGTNDSVSHLQIHGQGRDAILMGQ